MIHCSQTVNTSVGSSTYGNFTNEACMVLQESDQRGFGEEVSGMIEHPIPELGYDNATVFKASDEANAVMWLRCLIVYSTPRFLHLGRAIPRS